MTIDAGLLDQVMDLFDLSLPDQAKSIHDFANLLGDISEVFPWIIFHTDAISGDEDLLQSLIAAARSGAAPGTKRTSDGRQSLAVTAAAKGHDRALEALIRDNIERQNIGLSVDENLARLVRIEGVGGEIDLQDAIHVFADKKIE